MSDIPAGAIPVDQFQAAPEAANIPTGDNNAPHDAIPLEQFQTFEEKYETPGQMAKTFLEGAGQGALGPIAPAAERLLGVDPQEMRNREEVNPITHGVGEAAGLGGSLLVGSGLGSVMTKAGELAAHAAPVISQGMEGINLAQDALKAAQAAGVGIKEAQAALKTAEAATSIGFKVGSAAVQNAAEMAVLSGSDEVAKMLLQDPNQSADTAISNIGMSALLGAGAGAFTKGVASPLWNATVGPKVEGMLTGLQEHVNGKGVILPQELKIAQEVLGVEISPELKAAMSTSPSLQESFLKLKTSENPKLLTELDKFHSDLSEAVAKKMNLNPEDIKIFDEANVGRTIRDDSLIPEFMAKYGPQAEAMERRAAEAAPIKVSDDERLDFMGRLLERGVNKVGTDSPFYKLYNEYGERILAKDTIGAMDSLKTELNGEIKKALRAGDDNTLGALRDIRNSINEFQETQISRQAIQVGKEMSGADLEALQRAQSVRNLGPETIAIADQVKTEVDEALKKGAEEGKKLGADLINDRAEINRNYAEFAKMTDELMDHMSIGRFSGAGKLVDKLNEITPEALVNKLSFKNNSDFIPFLQQHFPETFEKVKENELKRFLKPAILKAKGEMPIDVKKLDEIIKAAQAGKEGYVKTIMPEGSIEAVQSARALADGLPNRKDSGTPAGLLKVLSDWPRNAMATVGMLMGHNPIVGGLLGEMSTKLSTDVPDAIRLAHLRFMGSNAPVKAEGFKAMVDFMANTYKGENQLAKATKNLFKAGAEVIGSKIPDAQDREKLDKQVTKAIENPEAFMQKQQSAVGHYLPQHEQALGESQARAVQYLSNLKPKEQRLSPLDKPIPPKPEEIARYNRALDIAQKPTMVLQHIKEGTIVPSDVQDLKAMYPGLYKNMSQKLTNDMAGAVNDGEQIPYKTRVGLSLFLGTPVDPTLQPMNIMAAQPKPPQQQPNQGPAKGAGGKSMKSLGKSNSMYLTPNQGASADRSKRD